MVMHAQVNGASSIVSANMNFTVVRTPATEKLNQVSFGRRIILRTGIPVYRLVL